MYVSVPNLGILCQLFVSDAITDKQRWMLMRIMFGGQSDEYDFHKVGLIEPFLRKYSLHHKRRLFCTSRIFLLRSVVFEGGLNLVHKECF